MLFAFRLWQTTGCKHFAGFYFNPISIKINVEEQRNLDVGTDIYLSKFFHNKISSGFYQIARSYVYTFNPRYILEIIGPLGLTLALISFSKIIKNPKSVYTLVCAAVVLSSLLLILPIDPKKTFYINAICWFIFSICSAHTFSGSKRKLILFCILLVISFWYFAFSWQEKAICNEIFFN